jgi:hypothetical protein
MPYKEWADEEILQADDLNTYVVGQSVPRFADTTDRDAAIGAPADGQLCHVTGLGLQVHTSGTWTLLIGVPPGGTTGQLLAKASGTDYDLEWVTP